MAKIKAATDIKDLGIYMCSNKKFDFYIEKVTKKARVLRTFATRALEPMMTLFKAVVLPHLEYSCQVWSPVTLGLIRGLQ